MRPRASTFFHPDSLLFSSLSKPLQGAFAAVALAYGAMLAIAGLLSVPMLFAAGLVLSVAVELLRWRGMSDAAAIVLFWAPLHLLILATGSLASPALPLAAAWVVAIGVVRPAYAPWAAAGGTVLVVLGTFAEPVPLEIADVLRLLLLLGLAGAAPRFLGLTRRALEPEQPPVVPRGARSTRAATHHVGHPQGKPPRATAPRHLLNLVRGAAGASEAILWERTQDQASLHPRAWSGPADMEVPQAVGSLAGHPFSWALQEGKPVRLERGRKPLPRRGSTEMLLLPFSQGERLLTLSYSTAAPAGAEGAAVWAVNALEEFGTLLAAQPSADPGAGSLPHAAPEASAPPLRLDSFAALLSRATSDLSHAEGAALLLWSPDTDQGWVVAVTGIAPEMELPAHVRGAESQASTACATERALRLNDGNREAPGQPLLVAGERWEERPRSAMIRPVRFDGRVIGALLAWDSAPNHFHLRDEEGVDLLASIAAPVLQHTSREIDFLSTGMTTLVDRSVFQSRFVGLCGRFHRYLRPFAVITLDVDGFAAIREGWGPEVGNLVLRHLAALVRNALREVDVLARPDGAEFVVLLPETTLNAALSVAERIRQALQETPFTANGRPLALTASLGVAACPDTCSVATDTLAEARRALQRSQRDGTNRISAAGPGR